MRNLIKFIILFLMIFIVGKSNAQINLPIEVLWPSSGSLRTVRIVVPNGATPASLWIDEQGLEWSGEGSIQIGKTDPWIPLDNTHCKVLYWGEWGGIGGPVNRLQLTIPVTNQTGQVLISFKLNATDGVNSAFRIVGINWLDANNNPILPPNSFIYADPSKWLPPSTNPADIDAGKMIYTSSSLINSPMDTKKLNVTCQGCHTQDGRDLQYFNYTNESIISRCMFHGLTQKQGYQVASYIRSLPFKSVGGRPWLPPYQPGPGMDSKPVSEWAAGSGLVLQNDAAIYPYLFPQGPTTASFDPSSMLNCRETPTCLPLLTWNQWLPRIHPIDFWGSAFENSPYYAYADTISQNLANAQASGTLQSYITNQFQKDMYFWGSELGRTFNLNNIDNQPSTWWTTTTSEGVYSTGKWHMVKIWGLMQTYGLEDKTSWVFGTGPLVEPRGWFGGTAFGTAPRAEHIPLTQGNCVGGDTRYQSYLSTTWYELQLTQNASNGKRGGNYPIDWPYDYAQYFVDQKLTKVPYGLQLMRHVMKGTEEAAAGPPTITDTGWSPGRLARFPFFLTNPLSDPMYSSVPPIPLQQIQNLSLAAWLKESEMFTPAQYQAANMASPTDTVGMVQPGTAIALVTEVYQAIQSMKKSSVDQTLLQNWINWSNTLWPVAGFNNIVLPVQPAMSRVIH